jgi:DNA polymerase-3 subunit gamma/tau
VPVVEEPVALEQPDVQESTEIAPTVEAAEATPFDDEPPFVPDTPLSNEPVSSAPLESIIEPAAETTAELIAEPAMAAPQVSAAAQADVAEAVLERPLPEMAIAPEPQVAQDIPEPEPQPVADSQSAVTEAAPVAEPQVQEQSTEPVVIDMALSPASWPLIFEKLPLEGMLRNLVANSCLIQIDGNELLFHGDSGHMRLFSESHQQKFNEVLNSALEANYSLKVIDGPLQYETPAQRAQRLAAEKQQSAVESIENDPNVQALRQAFNAQVIMDTITPLH